MSLPRRDPQHVVEQSRRGDLGAGAGALNYQRLRAVPIGPDRDLVIGTGAARERMIAGQRLQADTGVGLATFRTLQTGDEAQLLAVLVGRGEALAQRCIQRG